MKKWYKLDNVGTFYASLSSAKIPNVFRYSAKLKDEIDEDILQEAYEYHIAVSTYYNGCIWHSYKYYYG